MTNETMNLKAAIEKTPNADLLREMIGFAAERLMDMEVTGQTGAAYGEKNPDGLLQHEGRQAAEVLRLKNGIGGDRDRPNSLHGTGELSTVPASTASSCASIGSGGGRLFRPHRRWFSREAVREGERVALPCEGCVGER